MAEKLVDIEDTLRQWRFNSKEDINEKLLLEYIKEAIEIEKSGVKPPGS